MTSGRVAGWHRFLCTVAALNVTLWIFFAVAATQGAARIDAGTLNAVQTQLLLSAAYVFGCAFRSILPVYDIPRLVVVDSPLSGVIVGRTVASIAELCFAGQWALMLHRMSLLSHTALLGHTAPLSHMPLLSHGYLARAVSLALLPLIALAELSSWYSVLTTRQRGHVIENSLWGLSAAMVVSSVLMIGPHRLAEPHPLIIAWCAGGTAYVVFIFFFDVPMYWSRWRADQSGGRHYLSLAEGMADAWRRRVVSHRWEDWKSEVPWMSLYFSVGVWSSVSLVYASAALGAPHH